MGQNKHFKKLPKETQDRIIKANKSGQPDAGTGLGKKLHRWLNKEQQPNE